MRAQRTALLRITHGSHSRREARTPTAPAGHLLAAPRRSAACGHGIAADKGNSLVRHARTAHRAGAHYAWLTLAQGGRKLPPPLRGTSLKEGGKFYLAQKKSHFPHIRNKYVAKGVTALCLPAINHRYKQGFPAQYAPICRLRGFQEGVNAPSAIM